MTSRRAIGFATLMAPPRLRLTPLRCPHWGRDSRLGAVRRRSCVARRGDPPRQQQEAQHRLGVGDFAAIEPAEGILKARGKSLDELAGIESRADVAEVIR